MYYPIKLKPVYKYYIWGGRYFEKFNRELPDGLIAESWELSCHKNGVSTIANGEFAGKTLLEIVKADPDNILGTQFPSDCGEIPLLIKLIDANDRLSVQVHPGDSYAAVYEDGMGKNEMWYIIDAKPGARLVAGLREGVTKESFIRAIEENSIEECLLDIEVKSGDVISIPAGLVHAIGSGIVIAEIQQMSDATYRIFDYGRVDSSGAMRPLHLKKALEVIDFNANTGDIKRKGVVIKVNESCSKTVFLANKYFACERYDVNGSFAEKCDGSKFFIFICLEGNGSISSENITESFSAGETVFIPAGISEYKVEGYFSALKTYVPNYKKDIVEPMRKAGCTSEEIYEIIDGD